VPSDKPGEGQPLLHVIRGDASTEEVAAVLAVLAARRVAAEAAEAATTAREARGQAGSGWSDRSRRVRAPMFPGPGGWRRSALPH